MKLKRCFDEKKLDAVLVTNILNVRFLTGFTGTTGTVIALKDKKYFITDFRYVSQGKMEVEKNGYELICENISTYGKIAEILKENNVKRLGIENQSVTLSQFDSLKGLFGEIEYIGLDNYFLEKREIKDKDEIDIIKRSIKVAEEGLKNSLEYIKKGITERELAGRIEFEMRKLGADKPSFDIIVASNERSALPHGVASDKVIEEGFLTIDYGCFYNGYASDITRTFYIGENPTDKHREIYNIVKEANEMAIKAVKPGITIHELDAIARDYIKSKGYGEYFGHGLGHGIGLEIHEYPGVSYKAENKKLVPGMIITIEPGIYIPEFGGVRIEDDVLVTEDGYEVLTSLEKDFKLL